VTADEEIWLCRMHCGVCICAFVYDEVQPVCSLAKLLEKVVGQWISHCHLTAQVIPRLPLYTMVLFLSQTITGCVVHFVRRNEPKVDASSAFREYTLGIKPMIIVQSKHQQLTDSSVVFEVRAYTCNSPWSQERRKPAVSTYSQCGSVPNPGYLQKIPSWFAHLQPFGSAGYNPAQQANGFDIALS
jgi:hypothetical protein